MAEEIEIAPEVVKEKKSIYDKKVTFTISEILKGVTCLLSVGMTIGGTIYFFDGAIKKLDACKHDIDSLKNDFVVVKAKLEEQRSFLHTTFHAYQEANRSTINLTDTIHETSGLSQ